MRNKPKIGEPVRASLQRNCLLCTKWVTCSDPAKRGSYACSRFREDEEAGGAEELQRLFDEVAKPKMADDIEQRIKEADTEDSISDIIEEILNSGIPVTPDLRIDDRHMARPDNFFQWVTEERFVGTDQPPFAKQIQVGIHLLAEWCPDCSDEEYFEEVPVDADMDEIQEYVTFLKRGVCPSCKRNKAELIAEEILNDPTELIGIAGQRATKSATTVLIDSYTTQHWLLTPNLSKMFNILNSTPIVSTYTSTTFGQARENLWEPLNTLLTNSVWYKEYHDFLRKTGFQLGEELFTHNDINIRYRHKNLFMSPAPPSKRTMRGRTRRNAAIDELGWFPVGTKKDGQEYERLDGKEVHVALRNSLKTLTASYKKRMRQGYYNTPKPLMINISSPSARNDEIMKLYRNYVESNRTHYCFLYKTWEFNPLLTEEDFAEDFRKDPVKAARDYACEPPMGVNAWFTDQEALEGIFGGANNGIKTFNSRIISNSGKPLTAGHYKIVRTPKTNYSGILALDPGYNNNSFAFCIAYPTELPDDPETQADEEDPIVKTSVRIHAVGEIIPRKDAPISYTALYKRVLMPLCEQFNIAVTISDRWQNIKMMQDLEDATGAAFFEHRLTMTDFNNYHEAIFDEEIKLPKLEMDPEDIINIELDGYPHCFNLNPVSHLFYQHLTVVSTGNAVLKGSGTTDDLFRACVLAYTGLQQPEILDAITEVEEVVQREVMSVSGSYGSGARRGNSAGRHSGGASAVSVMGSRSGAGGSHQRGGGLTRSRR